MRRRELLKLVAALAAGGASGSGSAKDAEVINIQFTRFSAFYTPLIVVIAAGYLEQEGLKPHYSVAAVGKSALLSLADGSSHVVQSAPGNTFLQLEKGIKPSTAHFAQINGRDGFFLVGKDADPNFSWSKLNGATLLISFDTQPMAMFRYACMKQGVDPKDIKLIKGGSDESMIDAYQAGGAQYIHLQGPGPQQLEKIGAGHVVAALGNVTGECAFSSLAANRDWLATDMARRFTRAYRRACQWIMDAKAPDIAGMESHYFDEVDVETLTAAIAAYKTLGNWSQNIEISHAGFDKALDVFQNSGLIKRRYAYDDVVVAPPPDVTLALIDDLPELQQIVAGSVRGLSRGFYSEQQIESALRYVFGIDSTLIADQSYFVARIDQQIAGCGGWSRRNRLYGGDQHASSSEGILDPAHHPARIRAFFVVPGYARRGVASALYRRCAQAALEAGFSRLELMATLPGVPFYQQMGFVAVEHGLDRLPDGCEVEFVRMQRPID